MMDRRDYATRAMDDSRALTLNRLGKCRHCGMTYTDSEDMPHECSPKKLAELLEPPIDLPGK